MSMTNYEDIIDLPHHVSVNHPHMSLSNRAAQFAPFAALTGYEDAVQETARLTDKKVELDENRKAQLDERLMIIQEVLAGEIEIQPDISREIKVLYFKKDEKKEGGSYEESVGEVKKIDAFTRRIVMMNGTCINLSDIVDLDGELFYTIE